VSATITISSDGQKIDLGWRLLSLDVRREINRIPTASLVYSDETSLNANGPAKKAPFSISNTKTFQPGARVEIKLRHDNDQSSEATVFKGLVVRNRIEADGDGCRLNVDLKDAAVRMTSARKWKVFLNAKDSAVIGQLAQGASLTVDTKVATTVEYPELVQYDCTDWDFSLARAEANGLVLMANDGQIVLAKIALEGMASQSFNFDLGGMNNLEIELDACHQAVSFQSFGWDPTKQAVSGPTDAASFALRQGNLAGDTVAKAVGFGTDTLRHPVPLTQDELKAWADGRLARSRMALLRGRFSVPGFGKLKLLDLIELKNVGQRFSGTTVITGLRHSIGAEGWQTDIQFGLSTQRVSEQDGFNGPSAAGLLAAPKGLQTGLVKKIVKDPANEYRIQVQLATMGDDGAVIWARWASSYAAGNHGWFFLPDVGDEVVVGFFNEDPRYPIILGSLYSSKNAPPAPYQQIDEKNLNKGLVTRGGTKLSFVDADKPKVSLETPGGNKVVLDDQNGITITDQNGNKVTMDNNGISVESAKDLSLKAKGKITINGQAVEVQ
jgi:Rhs element Vgr protein